jgi:lipopolysaccharide transport system permease protein
MLVLCSVLNDGIHLMLSIPVVLGFLLFHRIMPSWEWLAGIPLFLIAQFMTVYGAALTVASLNLFFRDLERLTALCIAILFFLTPIAYPSDMVPAGYRFLLFCNPVAPLMEGWRRLFLNGQLDWMLLCASCLSGLIVLGVGSVVYTQLSPKFAEMI